jgi:uncharacterized membrane protein
MNRLLTSVALAAFALAPVACNETKEGGNPGTKDSFTLSGPTLTTTIKQGDKQTVKVSVNRGSEFKKAVALKVSDETKGLKATLDKTNISAGDPADVNLAIDVDMDAPVGDGMVKVTGTPEGGGTPTTLDVKVKVDAR